MTWTPGRDRVQSLLDAGELEKVAADERLAARLLADAGLHLDTATAGLAAGDLTGAYQLAYDALRKSAAALLAAQGLRATSRGGHVAIQDAVAAQFGSTVRVLRAFSRIRRARNSFEYPDSDTAGPSPRRRPRRSGDCHRDPGCRHHHPGPKGARPMVTFHAVYAGTPAAGGR